MTEYFSHPKEISTNVRDEKLSKRAFRFSLNFLWKFSPGLAKAIVRKLFFSPAHYRAGTLERKLLHDSRAFDISVNGKTIKCWQWGKGPAILLVHGWNGRGIQLHAFIEPLVAAGYQVITLDAPGHGVSEGKTSSYFEYSDVIREIIRWDGDLNIKGIIAHSLGASAVVCALAKEASTIGAVLVAPALRLSDILADSFDTYGCPRPIMTSLIREFENRFGYSMQSDNPYNLLADVAGDLLVIHDTEDGTVPYADSLDASRQFRNIKLRTTHGLGHKKHLFDDATINFILGHVGSKTTERQVAKPKNMKKKAVEKGTFQIGEQYRAAGFENRLHMFLECPDLRKEFMEIELTGIEEKSVSAMRS